LFQGPFLTTMDLLEYQAKELFRQMGIPVLPSQRIDHPRELKDLKISYPVVLKSQVPAGGRAKAGGIRFVENTIDAVAAAQTIFNLPIMGQYPEVVLAESKYDADRELYLAVALDQASRRPLLLGSQEGGKDTESILKRAQQVVIDQEFSPFYARRLVIKMGLRGELIRSVSLILEKMYRLFLQEDLDLVEINPLAVSHTGELMSLDGKITANDNALGRHGNLAALKAKLPSRSRARTIEPLGLELVELDGNIGVLCNGVGLTMATLDLVHLAGGKPASFLNVGRKFHHDLPPTTLQQRIEQGLELITRSRGARVIVINLFTTAVSCVDIAMAIVSYLHHHSTSYTPQLVVRLVGNQLEEAKDLLEKEEVLLFGNLEEAIAQAVALSSSKSSKG
jgi:succinyl-CoA synthetase beta subunit